MDKHLNSNLSTPTEILTVANMLMLVMKEIIERVWEYLNVKRAW